MDFSLELYLNDADAFQPENRFFSFCSRMKNLDNQTQQFFV